VRIPTHDKKSNFHIAEVLSFIIGAVCMFGALYVLVFPAMERDAARALEESERGTVEARLALEDRVEKLQLEVDRAYELVEEFKERETNLNAQLNVQERTNRVLNAYGLMEEDRLQEAVDIIDGISTSGLASDIIEKAAEIRIVAYPLLARQYYDEGVRAHDQDSDFAKALADFERAYRYAQDGFTNMQQLLYYLATLYAKDDDMLIKALDFISMLQERYPNFNTTQVSNLKAEVEAAMAL
jgi:tetratricopeptide (TPR) repeat protein